MVFYSCRVAADLWYPQLNDKCICTNLCELPYAKVKFKKPRSNTIYRYDVKPIQSTESQVITQYSLLYYYCSESRMINSEVFKLTDVIEINAWTVKINRIIKIIKLIFAFKTFRVMPIKNLCPMIVDLKPGLPLLLFKIVSGISQNNPLFNR